MAYIAIRQGRQIMTTSKSTWAILPTTFIILYYWCSVKLLSHHKKLGLNSSLGFSPFRYLCFCDKTTITMGKGTHLLGQPVFGQLISLLSKPETLKFVESNSFNQRSCGKIFSGYLLIQHRLLYFANFLIYDNTYSFTVGALWLGCIIPEIPQFFLYNVSSA